MRICFEDCASMRVSGCVRVCIGERGEEEREGEREEREREEREDRERAERREREREGESEWE